MDEAQMEASLEAYKSQASQLETALLVTEDEATKAELSNLLEDMKQLTKLTEDSLLSLRKSKLMSMLERPSKPNVDTPGHSMDMDAEFAAFQAAISDDPQPSGCIDEGGGNVEAPDEDGDSEDCEDQGEESVEDELRDIIGHRCRVPFSHDWGEQRLHNAMIVSVEELNGETEPKVRVMFCNPTHRSLLPCPYYLEGKCKFDEQQCRYSHGHVVSIDDLGEFEEPDHGSLKIESKCIARYSDNVWYPAIIVDILEDHKFKVMFEKYDNTETVSIEDVVPQEDTDETSEDDDASGSNVPLEVSDGGDDSNDVPVYLWRPNQTTEKLGDWEKHTTGFGSRLMAKMGYIMGQGLGKSAEGRAEPVPIQLLPPGKSLDKIMELKERAGDQDLYDVMKKNRRKQKQIDKKATAQYVKAVDKEHTTFDFINKRLGGKKGNLNELRRPKSNQESRKTIAESELQNKSDKHINIQLLKTHEETRNVEKEIRRLKDSLQRNNGRDKGMTMQIQQKLSSMESYLQRLKTSEDSMNKHKKMRSDHKKYTVF